MANEIIVARNLLIPRLTSLKEISYSFFFMVFDDIFDLDCHRLSLIEPKNKSQEVKLMARLLAYISNDLFAISLEHIKAEDIVNGEVISIHDLLEIIFTFIEHIPRKFAKTRDAVIDVKLVTKSVQTSLTSEDTSVENIYPLPQNFDFDYLSSKSISSSDSSESTSIEVKTRLDLRSDQNYRRKSPETSIRVQSSQESKAIQTEDELIVTDVKSKGEIPLKTASIEEVTLEEYKRMKYENFATVLGNRLHETLKLKEMADNLEMRINHYFKDVTANTKQRRTRSSPKITIQRYRTSLPPKAKTPLKCKAADRKISPNRSQNAFSLDQLLKNFPEIPRNTIKSLKEEENRQKKAIENLNKEISMNQMKVKSKLKEAIERQEKKSNIIANEAKQMQSLLAMKGSKAENLKEMAAKRESRLERARIKKMIDKFQNELNSKYKRLQSIEERIVVQEFDKKRKQQNDCINEFRKSIRERHLTEMERQKRILDSIDTLLVQCL